MIQLPDQVKRLLLVIAIIVVVFLLVRNRFIPDTFGDLGHYRAAAIDSISALEIHYAGHKICEECHDDIAAQKAGSYHRNVNCESCHGPAHEHVESGGEVPPHVPRERAHCLLCHVYNPAKPTGFPQIDPVVHNPVRPCIVCHDSHAPDPPETPEGCNACHGGIYRTKALSPHAPLECTECHTTPADHVDRPRIVRASKPTERSHCTKCHAKGTDVDRFIPKIDATAHGESYLCWECHYPHYPEAK